MGYREAFSVVEGEREFQTEESEHGRIRYMGNTSFINTSCINLKFFTMCSIWGHGSNREGWGTVQSDDCLIWERIQKCERHMVSNKGGILIGLRAGWPPCAPQTKLILWHGSWLAVFSLKSCLIEPLWVCWCLSSFLSTHSAPRPPRVR